MKLYFKSHCTKEYPTAMHSMFSLSVSLFLIMGAHSCRMASLKSVTRTRTHVSVNCNKIKISSANINTVMKGREKETKKQKLWMKLRVFNTGILK